MSNMSVVAVDTDILYDKIIDVELQRVEPDIQIKTIISTLRDSLDADSVDRFINSRSGLPIAIYKGDYHYEYVRGASGSIQKIRVEAGGISLGFGGDPEGWWKNPQFLDQIDSVLKKMEKDKEAIVNPSKVVLPPTPWESRTGQVKGTPTRYDTMKGCRIQFQYGGKLVRYHAVYLQSDEISTSTYHVTDTLKIGCSKGGLKPSISFTTNLIPGNNCYKMILKITNLNLDWDVRSVKRIKITAGYRTQGMQQIFNCPVFSSYIESPNPDGVTVFECLCVGTTDTVSENRPIHFIYHGGKITIYDFIKAIGDGLEVPVYNYLLNPSTRKVKDATGREVEVEDPGYNGLDIHISGTNLEGKETYAENAAATLTWARQIIQKRIAAAEGFTTKPSVGSKIVYPYIRMDLTSDGLVVYALNKPNSDSNEVIQNKLKEGKAVKDVVVLDAVKGATFNGIALTVKSLWNPKVRPGSIFQMRPNIYNGANMPNVITKEQYGDDEKRNWYYRCITSAISFSTNGSENEMSILAIPIVYMEEESAVDPDSVISWDQFIAVSQATFDISGARVINFGMADKNQVDETPVAQNKKTVTTNTNDMFDLDILNYFPNTMDYIIQEGDNLSTLAQKFFREGAGCCDFKIQPEHPEDLPEGVWEGDMDDRAFLWPLIAVLTYRKYKLLKETNSSINGYETMEHMRNPDMIRTGRKLVIPIIPNFATLQYCRNMFKYALGAWSTNFPSYGNWVRAWATVFQYLGGTL